MKLLSIAFFLSLNLLYASSTQHYNFTTESSLHVQDKIIEKAYFGYKKGFFKTSDKYKIYYVIAKVKNEKASIVISSGRTEAAIKYKELIYDLNQNGYSVYIMDHRGQGFSDREYTQDTQLGYISDFNHYIEDLKTFVELHVKIDKPRELFLLAHSMGGAIASLYIEKYVNDFDAIAMTSPMHSVNMITPLLNPLICKVFEHENMEKIRYVFGQSSYDKSDKSFKKNILTHSEIRYERMINAYEKYPKAKLGGVSPQWVKEACIYSKQSIDNAKRIKKDILLLSAEEDKIVDISAQKEFCENVGSNCTFIPIKESYHEILIEKDSIREESLGYILHFFAKYL